MSLKLVIISVFLIIITFMMILWVNSIQINPSKPKEENPITSFEECEAKGYAIQESYPRKCSVGGKTFTEEINSSRSPKISPEPEASSRGVDTGICQDKCGDELCQLVVCQGSNCPCAEDELNCPQDCR